MNQTKNSFDIFADEYLSFLDNEYVSSGLILFLILYASVIAPKLPSNIASCFKHPLIQLILFFIIVFLAKKDVSLAIITAVSVLVTIMVVNYNCNKSKEENMTNYNMKNKQIFNDLFDKNTNGTKTTNTKIIDGKNPFFNNLFNKNTNGTKTTNREIEENFNQNVSGESHREGPGHMNDLLNNIYKEVYGVNIYDNGNHLKNMISLYVYDMNDVTFEELIDYLQNVFEVRNHPFDFNKTLNENVNIVSPSPIFKNTINDKTNILFILFNKYGNMKLGNFITAHGRNKIRDILKLNSNEINKYYMFAGKLVDNVIENNHSMIIRVVITELPLFNTQLFFNNLDMTLNDLRKKDRKLNGVVKKSYYLENIFNKYGNNTVALFLQNFGDKNLHTLFSNVEEKFDNVSKSCNCHSVNMNIKPNRNRINNNMPFMSNTYHLDERVNNIDAIDLENDASNFMLDGYLYTDFQCNRM